MKPLIRRQIISQLSAAAREKTPMRASEWAAMHGVSPEEICFVARHSGLAAAVSNIGNPMQGVLAVNAHQVNLSLRHLMPAGLDQEKLVAYRIDHAKRRIIIEAAGEVS